MVELILRDPEVRLAYLPHPATGEPDEFIMGLELLDRDLAERHYLALGYSRVPSIEVAEFGGVGDAGRRFRGEQSLWPRLRPIQFTKPKVLPARLQCIVGQRTQTHFLAMFGGTSGNVTDVSA